MSRREAPLGIRIDTIGAIAGLPNALDFKFEMDRYLAARGDRTITNWAAWIAHARFRDDATRANAENWTATKANVSAGKTGRLAISQVGSTVLLKVMRENRIDPVRASGEHRADAKDPRSECGARRASTGSPRS